MAAPADYRLEGRTLAYTWSHGPHPRPLVVLHGLGDSSIHTYAPRFQSTVMRHRPSLFVDLPGFGEGSAAESYPGTLEQMADDVASLISALHLDRPIVFGHSMGANVAIMLASRHPGLTGWLILAEPLLDPSESILAAGIARQSEDVFRTRGQAMLLRATSLQAHRGDKAAIAFLDTLKLASTGALYRAAQSLVQHREPVFADMLTCLSSKPALIIGERSSAEVTPYEEAGLTIRSVPNAGHFVFAEETEATAYVMLDLVNRFQDGGHL